MDILDDILDTLNMQGVIYFRTDFSPPWGVTVPKLEQAARFHLVVQGHCYVCFQSGDCVHLTAGDIILIPYGASHIISDVETTDAPNLETTLSAAGYQGNGVLVLGEGNPSSTTQLICGHFSFRKGADHPLMRALPDYFLTTTAVRAQNPWLDETLRMVTQRLFSDSLGSASTVKRLSEIVFIELLRSCISANDQFRAILHAFTDGQIGEALLIIHQSPERSWTVSSLASEVGMSRTRFAQRFNELVGLGPISYLADWRLQKALALLDTSRINVQQVASKIGYVSPAAFTRAFSTKFGVSPTEYRKNLH